MNVTAMVTLKALTVPGRLQAVTAQLQTGQLCHLLGANGAGKTTLLNVLCGLQFAQLEQCQVNAKRQEIVYVQSHFGSPFALPVAQCWQMLTGRQDIPEAVNDSLQVTPLWQKSLGQLSSGEQQRLHLALMLADKWPALQAGRALVLLDEPFNHLDMQRQDSLIRLITTLQDIGNTIVITHHDQSKLAQLNKNAEIWRLRQGQLTRLSAPFSELSISQLL